MKIIRTIDGKEYEFELDYKERHQAYLEEQHYDDMSDIDNWYSEAYEEEFNEEMPNDLIDEIATEYRANINSADCDYISEFYYDMAEQAYEYVMRHRNE